MATTKHDLQEALTRVLGSDDARWQAMAATDPEIVAEYIKLAESTDRRKALAPKERELIYIAVASSTAHLFEPGIRLHIANALRFGASKEEILDVLRLTSVLGVHTMIPAAAIVADALGGGAALREQASEAQRQRVDAAKARFLKARGFLGDVWESVAMLTPDFLEAYADYSGLPHRAGHLSPKLRELVYVAIDISPTHFNEGGARSHLQSALQHGATRDEVMEAVEIASLIGFHTCMVALPILAQELEKRSRQ